MKTLRISLALLAAAALVAVGAVFAAAAPGSLAARSAGAQYCTASVKANRAAVVDALRRQVAQAKRDLKTFRARQLADRRKFNRTHRGPAVRARFARRQDAQYAAVKKAADRLAAKLRAARNALGACS